MWVSRAGVKYLICKGGVRCLWAVGSFYDLLSESWGQARFELSPAWSKAAFHSAMFIKMDRGFKRVRLVRFGKFWGEDDALAVAVAVAAWEVRLGSQARLCWQWPPARGLEGSSNWQGSECRAHPFPGEDRPRKWVSDGSTTSIALDQLLLVNFLTHVHKPLANEQMP